MSENAQTATPVDRLVILPCPFCGTSYQTAHGSDSEMLRMCRVVCNECLFGGPNFNSRDMAIAWWNRRAK